MSMPFCFCEHAGKQAYKTTMVTQFLYWLLIQSFVLKMFIYFVSVEFESVFDIDQ